MWHDYIELGSDKPPNCLFFVFTAMLKKRLFSRKLQLYSVMIIQVGVHIQSVAKLFRHLTS